jgi:hypothetical protein
VDTSTINRPGPPNSSDLNSYLLDQREHRLEDLPLLIGQIRRIDALTAHPDDHPRIRRPAPLKTLTERSEKVLLYYRQAAGIGMINR